MKNILIALSLLITGSLMAQISPIDLYQSNARTDQRQYGDGVVRKLVAGENLIRQGRWEEAILTYDNVVAQWPNWAPAYIKRAMAKAKMGRQSEAQEDLQRAQHLSPNSVILFSERNPGQKVNLLATAPQDDPELEHVYRLKQKGLLQQAEVIISEMYQKAEISATDAALLRGNIQLLLENHQHAIAYYNWALDQETSAEVLHNRGLARILVYNFPDGCADLEQAKEMGYDPSAAQYVDLCSF